MCVRIVCVDSVCEAYVCERRIVLVFHAPLRPFPSMQPLAPDGAHAVWYVRDAVLRREAAATGGAGGGGGEIIDHLTYSSERMLMPRQQGPWLR